jgi:hypothetical protein
VIEAVHSGRTEEERRAGERLRELEAQGVDVSLLAEQLRLSPTARIESMLRLRELCAALVEAETNNRTDKWLLFSRGKVAL